jgi:hypothetical protein
LNIVELLLFVQKSLVELNAGYYYRDVKASGLVFAVILFSQYREALTKFRNTAVTEWEDGDGRRGVGLLLVGTLARMKKEASFSPSVCP